jgi:hypothetical protein
MDIEAIYTGLPVRVTGIEGTFEIINIDYYSMSVWCSKINSIDNDLREVRISELNRL